jgi:hypothetical protein
MVRELRVHPAGAIGATRGALPASPPTGAHPGS